MPLIRSASWTCLAASAILFGIASCADRKLESLTPTAKSIQGAVVNTRCVKCHGDQGGAGGVSLTNIEEAMTKKVQVGGVHDHKPLLLVPGCPEHSLFYLVVRDKKMPPPGSDIPALSSSELQTIEQWIRSAGKPCGPDTSEPGTPDEPLDPDPPGP